MKKMLLFLTVLLFMNGSFAQNWLDAGNGLPSHSANSYNEITQFNGDLYAVGYIFNGTFNVPDSYTAKVFKLSGGSWSEVGSGFESNQFPESTRVLAIAEYNGELYIGGTFTMDNGVDPPFNHVAKWDATNGRWVQVGNGNITGSDIRIQELTVYDGKLYAGGRFTELGAAGVNGIAAWSGASWEAVGTGISMATNGSEEPDQVTSMVVYNGELFVGGKFTDAGGELVQNVATWNGTTWEYLVGNAIEGGGGVGGFNNGQVDILSMEVFDGKLYIGGTFSRYYNISFIGASTNVSNHLVEWNGTSFSAPFQSTPFNNRISAMTVFQGRIYIGNTVDSNIYSWDGGIFNWRLEPDRGSVVQRPRTFYANGTNIMYGDNYGVWKLSDPAPQFSVSNPSPCEGETVTFTDLSTSSSTVTSWNWTFPGGTPASSSDQNPEVVYNVKGDYDVTLTVTSAAGTNTTNKVNAIAMSDDITVGTDPLDATRCAGFEAIFFSGGDVGLNGSRQWQVNDGNGFVDIEDGGENKVSGSTSTTLKFTPTFENNGYKFRMKLLRCSNEAFTGEATLTVNETPIIEEEHERFSVCESGDATFTVAASASSGTPTYQWRYRSSSGFVYSDLTDNAVFSGTTTPTLNITGADETLPEIYLTETDGTKYVQLQCVVTLGSCSATTKAVKLLSIHEVPTDIITPLMPSGLCDTGSGVDFSFNVTTGNSGIESYQWQVDDGTGFVDLTEEAPYSGTKTRRLSITGGTTALNGFQYRLEIGACASPVYSDVTTWMIDERPVITQQPMTTRICEGGDATFKVTATGENLGYQWQERIGNTFVDITNDATYFASGETLQITGATTAFNNRIYRCVVSSGACSLNSSTPQLIVNRTPSFNRPEINDVTVCDGQELVRLFGPTPSNFVSAIHSYQWQEAFAGFDVFVDIDDGETFTGTNTRILIINSPTVSMSGNRYRLKIDGCVTEVVTDPSTLTIIKQPVITSSPESQSICLREQVSFSVTAVGDEDMEYEWLWSFDNGENFSAVNNSSFFGGQRTSTLTSSVGGFSNTDFDGYQFKCRVRAKSPCRNVLFAESFVATLNVNEVTATGQPTFAQVCEGEDASFVVEARGKFLTYQWMENDQPITDGGIYSGANSPTLTLSEVPGSMNGNSYKCVVNGLCEGFTSLNINLSVIVVPKPEITPDESDPNSVRLSSSNSYNHYEWFRDGNSVLSSSNASSITLNQFGPGSYTLIGSFSGFNLTCPSEESEAYIYIDEPVALGVGDEFEIRTYPNPVQHQLNIDFDKPLTAELFSLDGKMALRQEVERNQPLNLKSLREGQYILKLFHENQLIHSDKIIKTN